MAKRFISTDLFDDPEFIDVSAECKAFWVYMFCKCDASGVLKLSQRLAEMVLNGQENIAEHITTLEQLGWVESLGNNKYYLPKFIQFQYGELSEGCKPHRYVIELLKKHRLLHRVSKGYPKGIQTLKEQYKEKDKEKDIFKADMRSLQNEIDSQSQNPFQDAPESTFESLPMPSVGLGGYRQETGEPDGLFTKQDCIDTGQLAGLTEEQSTDFYIHYAAQGWKLGNGLPIVDLPSAMTRWKNKGFKFDTGGNGKKPKSNQPTLEEYERNLAEMTHEEK